MMTARGFSADRVLTGMSSSAEAWSLWEGGMRGDAREKGEADHKELCISLQGLQ